MLSITQVREGFDWTGAVAIVGGKMCSSSKDIYGLELVRISNVSLVIGREIKDDVLDTEWMSHLLPCLRTKEGEQVGGGI